MEKQPGIATWKVLPVVERNQGKERVQHLLSALWEQLLVSQPNVLLCSDTAEQKAVRFEPFVWLPGLDGDNRKGSFFPQTSGCAAGSTSAAADQRCLCGDAGESGSRFAVQGRGVGGSFAAGRWLWSWTNPSTWGL